MKFRITSPYGALEEIRNGVPHTGIDLNMGIGTKLCSLHDGVVEKVMHLKGNVGNAVAIKFDDGTTGIYGHMSKITVEKGEHVNAGDLIGLSGNSGNTTGPHLHFGLKDVNGEFTDPSNVIEQVAAMSGDKPSWMMEKYNHFADWVIGKEEGVLLKPFLHLVKDLSTDVWHWFILNLPDIMGYTTIASGVFIILAAMIGKGGIIKPIGVWAALMILALCILGGV